MVIYQAAQQLHMVLVATAPGRQNVQEQILIVQVILVRRQDPNAVQKPRITKPRVAFSAMKNREVVTLEHPMSAGNSLTACAASVGRLQTNVMKLDPV